MESAIRPTKTKENVTIIELRKCVPGVAHDITEDDKIGHQFVNSNSDIGVNRLTARGSCVSVLPLKIQSLAQTGISNDPRQDQ